MQRTFFALIGLLLLSLPATAQTVKFNALDKSPMDAAHYPFRSRYLNYLGEDDKDRTRQIRVLYSRPQVKGREIFGDLIPWGTDWRLGANEATEVTFFQDVEINGVRVPRGNYTMFAQVYPNQWLIKISTERFIGGSQDRDTSKDIVVATAPVTTAAQSQEYFTIGFRKVDDYNVDMVFAWDKTRATLPISLNAVQLEDEDASPMDLIQYPNMSRLRNFLKAEELAENEPQIRVVYSRPQAKGRKLFGDLIEYGKIWRLGANETPQITFFNSVTINGQTVKAGTYGLFVRPTADKWEFILHKQTQSWGSANYDEKNNVLTMTVPVERTPETLEAMSMTFAEKDPTTIHLVAGWGNTMAQLPIKLTSKK